MHPKESWEYSAATLRPYEAYEQLLDLDTQGLSGKRILDLGSGISEEFKAGVKNRNINAEVISLNPLLGPDKKQAD